MAGRGLILAAALIAPACASLDTVDKTPERRVVAEILLSELRCPADDEECDPAMNPVEIRFSAYDCGAEPLKPGIEASARALCAYEGRIIRADGSEIALAPTEREYLLINMTPGLRVPIREWAAAKPSRRKPVEKDPPAAAENHESGA